jgi:Glycosyltransferase family 87
VKSSLHALAAVHDRLPAWLRHHPIAVATAVVLMVLFLQVLLRPWSEWDLIYVPAGRHLWSGADIFTGGYTYPPFMALLTIPFGFLPTWLSRTLYFLMSALATVVLVRAAWRAAGGASFHQESWPRGEWYAFVLGLVCGAPYILNSFSAQQTDVMIAAVLMCGCLRLLDRRDASAGAFIGAATACKVTPLLWVPYLLWKRRMTAALAAVVVAVAVNLAPNVVSAPADGGLWLRQWVEKFLLKRYEETSALGAVDVRLKQELNRSIGGATYRLANTSLEFAPGGPRMVDRARVSTRTTIIVAGGIIAVLGLVSLVAIPLARKPVAAPGDQPDPLTYEFGIVLTLMLLMSPLSSSPHFATLVLPGFCLARLALTTGDRWIWAPLLGAALLTALSNKDLVGSTVYTALLWGGSTTLATILLWLGCVLALLRGRRVGKIA